MKNLNGLFFARHLFVAAAAFGVVTGAGCAADPDAAPPVAVDREDMLDDMDDGDDAIFLRGFREGYWYGFNDMTGGVQMPDPEHFVVSPGGTPASPLYSSRTWGMGFTKWGAGMGFDLNNPGDMANPNLPTNRGFYDISPFKGVTFKAKGNGQIRFAIATRDVITVEWKGTCVHEEVEGKMCDDTYGKKVNLSGEWRSFVIPFGDLSQEGFGQRFTWNPSVAMAVHFLVAENTTFDFYVDDIGFYK